MEAVILPIVGLLLLITLVILFFSKKNFNSYETKIYKLLLFFTIIFIIVGLITFVVAKVTNDFKLIEICQKIYMSILVVLNYLSIKYCIHLFQDNKKLKILNKFICCYSVLFIILILLLPLNVIYYDNVLDGNGLSYDIAIIDTVFSFIIFILITSYLLFSKISLKKIIPFITLIILYIISFILRTNYKELIFEGFFYSYILFIMYHTIENPDMKMLEEIEKNRNIIERIMEEKSNLLFKISQDVKVPLNNIESISNNMLNEKKVNTLINNAKKINNESKNISFIVNNLLDISSMNINNIKLYKTKIDINILLKEIDLMFNKKEFNYNILNTIPVIYGDNVRLKQIIVSIINYEYKHNSANIFLEISGIIRYDMCRLSINIISNGDRLDILEINNILDNETDINIDTNNLYLDLISIKVLINILNGSFNIKSDEKENIYSIIIDSEIVKKDNIITNTYINKKRVLLIDDDVEELKRYSKVLKKYNIDVTISMFGSDIINRIDNKEEYALILIDDEMQPYNAVTTLENINDKKIKSKIIVMLGINKEFIKSHYLSDYKFDDYLLKRDYESELERIINRYL